MQKTKRCARGCRRRTARLDALLFKKVCLKNSNTGLLLLQCPVRVHLLIGLADVEQLPGAGARDEPQSVGQQEVPAVRLVEGPERTGGRIGQAPRQQVHGHVDPVPGLQRDTLQGHRVAESHQVQEPQAQLFPPPQQQQEEEEESAEVVFVVD